MRSIRHLDLLDTLSVCIEDAAEALRAHHPEIDAIEGAIGHPPDVWLADAVVTHLGSLQILLSRYRAAANYHRRLLAQA
jgi:hypothetical protein